MTDNDNGSGDRDRGTYSPPTEDHLSYERRVPTSRDQAPVTLIVSGICLVVLLLAVVILYNFALNKQGKIAPEVGDPLGDVKEGQVQEAKPLSDQDMSVEGGVAFAPGSEVPGARPAASAGVVDVAPLPAAPITGPLPSQAGTSAAATSSAVASSAAAPAVTPAKPVVTPAKPVVAPPKPATTPPVAASGSSAVQIGAFTSTEIANREYAKVASSYGLFVGGAGKRVEKVTTPNGTFYRTAFTGLSAEKAKSFCAALKSAGQDCIVK